MTTTVRQCLSYDLNKPRGYDSSRNDSVPALAAKRIVAASGGPFALYAFGAKVSSTQAGTTFYIFVFDAAGVPANGAIGAASAVFAPLPVVGGQKQMQAVPGVRMMNGIVIALSTTDDAFTLASTVGEFECEFLNTGG